MTSTTPSSQSSAGDSSVENEVHLRARSTTGTTTSRDKDEQSRVRPTNSEERHIVSGGVLTPLRDDRAKLRAYVRDRSPTTSSCTSAASADAPTKDRWASCTRHSPHAEVEDTYDVTPGHLRPLQERGGRRQRAPSRDVPDTRRRNAKNVSIMSDQQEHQSVKCRLLVSGCRNQQLMFARNPGTARDSCAEPYRFVRRKRTLVLFRTGAFRNVSLSARFGYAKRAATQFACNEVLRRCVRAWYMLTTGRHALTGRIF